MNKYQREVDRGTRWLMRFNSIHHHWKLSDDLNYYDWLAGFGGACGRKVGKWRAVFLGAVSFVKVKGGFSRAEDVRDF